MTRAREPGRPEHMTTDDIKARIGSRRVVASVSGGKDSAAMCLHLRELGIEHDRVFMDTGWECAATYEYLRGDPTRKLGPITEVRGPRDMVELIRHKGMFPSKRRRFCTQELKVFPMQRHLRALMDAGADVVNCVGIRAAESEARSKMTEWEWSEGFDCEVWRPLLRWTEQEVIDIHTRHGLRPNPLYLQGMTRVGCWPCIFARKGEIRKIAELDPSRIDRLRDLEAEVSEKARVRYAAKGETFESQGYVFPSWFQSPLPTQKTCGECGGAATRRAECSKCGGRGSVRSGEPWPIDRVVEWSKTARGGRQFELFAPGVGDAGCMRWGLCETDAADAGEEKAK